MTGNDSKAAAPPRTALRRRPDKVSDGVARDIVADLVDKPPMTKLPGEAAMVEKYQVGRASIREALRILEVHGLITLRPGPGGGPTVVPFDPIHFARSSSLYLHMTKATYREVLEARLIFEPVMARLTAERNDPEVVALLQEYVALKEPEDEAEYIQQTGGFHALLSSLSGNRVLDLQGGALRALYEDRVEGGMTFPAEMRNDILRDHQRIANAVISGNANRAEKLMRTHMEQYLFHAAERNPGVLDEVVGWR